MRASIRRYIVSSGHEREAIEHAQDRWLPILKSVPGFVAYYFIDTGDGEMIGVSIFESAEGAARANHLAQVYVSDHLGDILKRTMLLEGEVAAFAGSGPD